MQLQEDFPERPRIFVLPVQVPIATFHLGRVQSAPVPPDDRKCRERDADQIQEHADERQGHVLGVNVLEAALGKVCFEEHSNAWTQIDAAKHLERPRAELGVQQLHNQNDDLRALLCAGILYALPPGLFPVAELEREPGETDGGDENGRCHYLDQGI